MATESNQQNPTLQLIWDELKDIHRSLSTKIDNTKTELRQEIQENRRRIEENRRGIEENGRGIDYNGRRIDELTERVGHNSARISHLEIKLSTEITAVAGAVTDTNRLLKGYNHRLTRVERKNAHLPDPGAI
jgi:chromosome segregation ATPase